jgi:hypothetical protein
MAREFSRRVRWALAVMLLAALASGLRAASQTPAPPSSGARELPAAESAWPSLRGPNYDGSATAGTRFGGSEGRLAVRWRAKIGSGYSGVAIAASRAVTMFSDGRRDVVVAFNIDNGQEA